MGLKERMRQENGGVLILVAIVLPLLLLVSAGGVGLASLYASNRELQRAADQAALGAAATIPPADPNVLIENPPFPLPGTDDVYKQLSQLGVDGIPTPADVENLMRDLIPDPRAVACALGSDALTEVTSAAVTNAFGDPIDNPLLDDGSPVDTVCTDQRIKPVLEVNPSNTTPVECTNRLIQQVADEAGTLDIGGLTLPSPIQTAVNQVVKLPLNHVLPAAFTPRMRVTTYSKVHPPLISFITGASSGTTKATAVAYRRVKNAVVVPILPAQQLQIALGVSAITVMTDPVNFNRALHTAQKPLIDAITDADNRLNSVMSTAGVPCTHMLNNLRQDLRDIYDPPTGSAPSALDIVDAAVTAAKKTSDVTAIPFPDPTNPDSLAGEAFLLIGVSVNNLMGPVAATQIPILDMALVSMSKLANGDYKATVISAANAHGAFRASLVQ